MITLVTTTRNRPEAFALCESFIRRQTVQPDQWLVVNDGEAVYEYTMGQEVILRDKSNDPPSESTDFITFRPHPFCFNWLAVLPFIKGDKVLVIEDDDYYGHPDYIATMVAKLDEAEVVGSVPSLYYNIRTRQYRDCENTEHTALAQTAFRSSVLPTIKEIAERGDPFIDMQLWTEWTGSKLLFPCADAAPKKWLFVGMKGLKGDFGIGLGHFDKMGRNDPNGQKLKEWIGEEDASLYL